MAEDKYRIVNLAISRSRRDGEGENIPTRDHILQIVKNFDPQSLQVPVLRGHEPSSENGDADGWILSVSAKEIEGDLVLFADELELSFWLGYQITNGARGPRSIRWHDNPYGKGAQMLHLAFLGAKNPGVDDLPPVSPEQTTKVEERLPATDGVPVALSNPIDGCRDCEYAPWTPGAGGDVPANRQEEIRMAEISDVRLKELEAKEAENSKFRADLELREKKEKDLEEKLANERKRSFDLSLSGVLAKAPEGVRDRIEKSARRLAKAGDAEGALDLAKELSEDAAKVVPSRKNLEKSLPDGKDSAFSGDPLLAFELEFADKAFQAGGEA